MNKHELDATIEELEQKIAPDGGETVLPLWTTNESTVALLD